jgi:hypothetical protein
MYENWTACQLREKFYSLGVGHIVFVKNIRVREPLGAGPCVKFKPQGSDNFYVIAESYAGRNWSNVIHANLDAKGQPLVASQKSSDALDSLYKRWLANLPAGSKRKKAQTPKFAAGIC